MEGKRKHDAGDARLSLNIDAEGSKVREEMVLEESGVDTQTQITGQVLDRIMTDLQ